MSQENVEIAKRMAALGDGGDIEGWLANCDTDVEWRDLEPSQGVPANLRGVGKLRSHLEKFKVLFDSPFVAEVQRREYIDAGDYVVTLTHRASLGLDWLAIEVAELRDGKVVQITVGYEDKDAALKAVGLAE